MSSRAAAVHALALSIAACGAPGPRDAPVTPVGWTTFAPPDGLYEIALPPGAALRIDPAGSSGGDELLAWAPEGAGRSMFGVLRRNAAVDLAAHLLDGDRVEAEVAVEIDGALSWRGAPARRVRARVRRRVERSWEADPTTGAADHRPEREEAELVDFVALTGHTSAIRVGYRLDRDAPPELAEAFAAMLESFTLRRPLR